MTDHIKMPDIVPLVRLVANGVQTVFEFPFPVFASEDLKIYIDGALQESGFTIAGAGATDPSADSTNWSNLSSDFTGRTWNGNTVDVAHGGTGATTITGLVRGNGTSAMSAAVAGTHYQAPIGTITGLAKGNGANALTSAVAGTDCVVDHVFRSQKW